MGTPAFEGHFGKSQPKEKRALLYVPIENHQDTWIRHVDETLHFYKIKH